MPKKNSANDLYWSAVAKDALRGEYEKFLRTEGHEPSPDSAMWFAMRKRNDGYTLMSEREIILLLAGKLPYMYD